MSEVLVTRARDRPHYSATEPVPSMDLRPILGTWVNYDERTTGIYQVEIGTWEGIPTVRVFGACPPAPIYWGEAASAVFADGVDGRHAVAFRANFDLTFAYVQLVGCLNRRLLVVGAYSAFTDRSRRASYYQLDHFYRP